MSQGRLPESDWWQKLAPDVVQPTNQLGLHPHFDMCMDLVNREQKFVKGNFYLASEFELGVAGPVAHSLPSWPGIL